MQTKKQSLVEVITDTFISILISMASYMIVLPLLGVEEVSTSQGFWFTTYFTIISIVRRYIVRRWFVRKNSDRTN